MNAVDKLLYDNEQKRYITTGECFQRKGNRERWIEDNVREEGKGITGQYPKDLPSCFCQEENLWGADIALLYRHYRYKLNADDNRLYKKWLKTKYKHIFD